MRCCRAGNECRPAPYRLRRYVESGVDLRPAPGCAIDDGETASADPRTPLAGRGESPSKKRTDRGSWSVAVPDGGSYAAHLRSLLATAKCAASSLCLEHATA